MKDFKLFLKEQSEQHSMKDISNIPIWLDYLLYLRHFNVYTVGSSERFFKFLYYQTRSLKEINNNLNNHLSSSKVLEKNNSKYTVMYLYDEQANIPIAFANLTLSDKEFVVEDLGTINSNNNLKSICEEGSITNCYKYIGVIMLSLISMVSAIRQQPFTIIDLSDGFYDQFYPDLCLPPIKSQFDLISKIPLDFTDLIPRPSYYNARFSELLELPTTISSYPVLQNLTKFSVDYNKTRLSAIKQRLFSTLGKKEEISLTQLNENLTESNLDGIKEKAISYAHLKTAFSLWKKLKKQDASNKTKDDVTLKNANVLDL